MNQRKKLNIEAINMLLRFMIAFTLVSMSGLLYTNDPVYVWKSLLLFPATVISFVVFKTAKHIWTYFLLSIILLAGYLLLADTLVLKVLYSIYIVGFTIIQFGISLKGKLKSTSMLNMIFFFATLLICQYKYPQEIALWRFFFVLSLLFGIIYMFNNHQVNYYWYIAKYEDKANIPYQQIDVGNRIYISIFIILCSICMLLFSRLPLGRILYQLGILLRDVLKSIISIFTKNPVEKKEVESFDGLLLEQGDMDEFGLEPEKPSVFWEILSKILFVATNVLLILAIIALIIYGFYKIYKLYYQSKNQTKVDEKVEILSPFEKIDLGFESSKKLLKSSITNLFGKSNNDKIRKQYARAIQKNTLPDKVLKYYTPRELSKFALGKTKQRKEHEADKEAFKDMATDEEKKLTALYEKARYSNVECSKEEVQSVKSLLK